MLSCTYGIHVLWIVQNLFFMSHVHFKVTKLQIPTESKYFYTLNHQNTFGLSSICSKKKTKMIDRIGHYYYFGTSNP